jgi:hypothetical protein
MKTKILFTLFAAFTLMACNKETYNTKPTLKLRSINTRVVPFNGVLSFEFEVTDKEGDITDSLFVKKIRLNRRVVPTIRDFFYLTLPQVTKIQKAQVNVDLDYQNYLISAINPPTSGTPPKRENDTLQFKFVLIDKANNASDTFTSEPIVITRQ